MDNFSNDIPELDDTADIGGQFSESCADDTTMDCRDFIEEPEPMAENYEHGEWDEED